MAIDFRCAACGSALRVADELAGRSVTCSECQTETTAPGVAADAVTAETRRSSPPLSDGDERFEQIAKPNGFPRWMTLLLYLAIVLAILCILAGLFVPNVRRIRESATHAQTMGTMKGCALAVLVFHDVHKRFPDAFGRAPNADKDASLWFNLLPWVEQIDAYQAGNTNAVVPPFLAPADPYLTDKAGLLCFAGNIRIFGSETLTEAKQPVNQPGAALTIPAGPMLSGLKLHRIADGTSNTIMLTTRYSNCGMKQTRYAADLTDGGFMGAGSYTSSARRNPDNTAIFQLAPSMAECLPSPALFGHSFGSSGMTISLADGSIRNISPSMSPETFGRAICPSDGMPMAMDWLDD